VWLGWFAMLTGVPPRVAHNFSKTAPAFSLEFKVLPVLLALALTLGWLYLVFFTTRSPMRSLLRWASGIVLLWGSFAMLWMPVGRLPEELPQRGAADPLEDPGRRDLHGAQGGSAYRSPRRSTTMAASAASPSISCGRTPARCSWCRAARSTSSTAPAPAGSSSPTSAGPVTARSATACIACRNEYSLADGVPSWAKLAQHAESWRSVHLRELFSADATRERLFAAEAPGVRFDYSRQRLGAMTLRLLTHLAAERGFPEWRIALLSGSTVNSTEKRAAWHTALRAGDAAPAEVKETLGGCASSVSTIREQKKFRRIVNLGTGGSDLGPRLVADA
jgi:hypothetical protein